jgi:hypothetical protein
MLRLFLILALVKSLTGVTYARPKIPGVDINGVVHPITVQTLVEIGTEKNSTIVFPLPVDIISSISKVLEAGRRQLRTWETGSPVKDRSLI